LLEKRRVKVMLACASKEEKGGGGNAMDFGDLISKTRFEQSQGVNESSTQLQRATQSTFPTFCCCV
jgi:hypothetical protein